MTVNSDTTSATPAHDPVSILDHFADLPDPRREQGRIHQLDEIVFMATCAVSARRYLGTDRGLCSLQDRLAPDRPHLARRRPLARHLPTGLLSARLARLSEVLLLLDDRADAAAGIDSRRRGFARTDADRHRRQGPTRLGAGTVGQSALHVVSAWAIENHLTLGQVATDAKSNEITAIPELLELLDLTGAVVTIDAMGCQKDIAAKIIDRGGEYVLAVKENQPHLYEDIARAFDEALDQGSPGVDFTECQTEGVRSGRQETRSCCVITNPQGVRNAGLWVGLTAIVMVISHRVVNGEASSETRYFIGSASGTAEPYLGWVRGHWGIENALHWVLDVCFREDDQRHWAGTRKELGVAPQAGVVSAQGGEEQQGQEYRHAPLGCGLEERLSLGCTGPDPREIDCSGRKPREIWCVSPGYLPRERSIYRIGRSLT